METYLTALEKKYPKIEHRDYPFEMSKAKRDAFDRLEIGTEETCVRVHEYLSKCGSGMWCGSTVRPDVAFALAQLGRFMRYPTEEHHAAVERVLGYLFKTKDLGITFGGKLRVPLGLGEMPANFVENRGLYAAGDSSWNKKPQPHLLMMKCILKN